MKSLLSCLLVLAAVLVWATDEVKLPAKDKFYLVLLTGQSNMAGRGFVTPEDQVSSERVLMLNAAGQWVPAKDPVHFDKSSAGVGPGLTFGKLLAASDPTITVGLIPAACGGSPISTWQPGKTWEQTKSNPYDDAIARTRKALESGTLKVILWHQGEADSGKGLCDLYQKNLTELFGRFRSEFGPNIPIVVGQLSQFPGEKWSESKAKVDAAQQAVVKTMPPSAFAKSDGFTANPDKIHFDAASQREFGKRYFEAYQSIAK